MYDLLCYLLSLQLQQIPDTDNLKEESFVVSYGYDPCSAGFQTETARHSVRKVAHIKEVGKQP